MFVDRVRQVFGVLVPEEELTDWPWHRLLVGSHHQNLRDLPLLHPVHTTRRTPNKTH